MRFYQINLVDTIQGHGASPSLVLLYVQGLPDTSLYAALNSGGWEHYGWGIDRHLSAHQFDATMWAGGSTVRTPRPEAAETKAKKSSIEDLFARLSRGAAVV